MKIASVFLILLIVLAIFACAEDDDDSSDAQSDDDAADDDTVTDDDAMTDDDATTDDDTPSPRAEIILPDYPFWPNDALTIDLDHLEDWATEYCVQAGDQADARDFFLGVLPMKAFDRYGSESPDPTVLNGDFYLSGYFGGVWLSDQLFNPTKDRADDSQLMHLLFNFLVAMETNLLERQSEGTDEEIVASARQSLAFLLMAYGYNLGYLQQVIAEPPPGIQSPDIGLVVAEDLILDCSIEGVELQIMDRYAPALELLRNPPSESWQEMADLVSIAEQSVDGGSLVWSTIPVEIMSEDAYLEMVDLSGGFLLALDAVALGNMTAYAENDAIEGRFSLLLEGGMSIWAFSYFMGLSSPALPGAFPELICP